jgi:hypothetical protein
MFTGRLNLFRFHQTSSFFQYNQKKNMINGAHPQSFEVLGDGYAKDTFHVYYQGDKISELMASTFVTLGKWLCERFIKCLLLWS